MAEEGRYLYCILQGKPKLSLEGKGVEGGNQWEVISYRDLGAVVSRAPFSEIKVTQENCAAHAKVLEQLMRVYANLLPFGFGMIAPHEREVHVMLRKNYIQLIRTLKKLAGKVELNVKALWHNMDGIFKEILAENKTIERFKREIASKSFNETYAERIEIGQMVARALALKKKKEGEEILQHLKRTASQAEAFTPFQDEVVLNAAFLVQADKRGSFEKALDELDRNKGGRYDFKFQGPLPPYSFVQISVRL